MKNVRNTVAGIVLCSMPFAAATYVCYSTLGHIEPADFRFWQPAFYSFFPMAFFFVGAVTYFTRRELRELRSIVDELRGTVPPAGGA